MSEETDNQPPNPVTQPTNNQDSGNVPLSQTGGEQVVQPSETIKQELQAQQEQQAVQLPVVASQSPQPVQTQPSTYTQASPNPGGQMMASMSTSQMGLGQTKKKLFDYSPQKLVTNGLLALLVLGGIFAVLVFFNIIALSEFKTMSYTNSKGTNYKVNFYTKHKTVGLKSSISGNNELVSKVSKHGKFPLILSISNFSISNGALSSYNKVKDCASFTKVFEVYNYNLNQKISVCDALSDKETESGVYIAGFTHNEQVHMITFGQDLSSIDLSSQTKFGIEPYRPDIETVVSSIKVE